MRCLVTGGAGFIGSHVVSKLLEKGHEVVVFDNLSSGYKRNIENLPVEFIEADIRDKSSLEKAMKDCQGVIHLAASVGNKKSIDEPYTDQEINYVGVLNVLESMRKNKVSSIVFSSSAGIFGEPQYQPVDEKHPCEPDSPYGVSKLAGEKLIFSYAKLYGIRGIGLRYFNVFGENQRFDAYGNVIPIFVRNAINANTINIFGDGNQTRDFVHAGDVAEANVMCFENQKASGAYNIGTGGSLKISDLAQKIVSYSNSSSKITYSDKRPGDVRHCTAQNSRIQSLGLSFHNDFDSQLKTYIAWMSKDMAQSL